MPFSFDSRSGPIVFASEEDYVMRSLVEARSKIIAFNPFTYPFQFRTNCA
jgi:hypothetical protein